MNCPVIYDVEKIFYPTYQMLFRVDPGMIYETANIQNLCSNVNMKKWKLPGHTCTAQAADELLAGDFHFDNAALKRKAGENPAAKVKQAIRIGIERMTRCCNSFHFNSSMASMGGFAIPSLNTRLQDTKSLT